MAKSKHRLKSNTIPALVTVGPVATMLILLVAIPLIYVAVMSFCKTDQYYNIEFSFSLDNYSKLLSPDYLTIYGQSLLIAFVTTVLSLLIGYPFAYIIARAKSKRTKKILYMLIIIPFWTNSLIRIYGWRTFLGSSGWLNKLLISLGIISEPADFLYNTGTTILGMVYCLIRLLSDPVYDPAALYGDRKAGRFTA